jgi:hypothetical protein
LKSTVSCTRYSKLAFVTSLGRRPRSRHHLRISALFTGCLQFVAYVWRRTRDAETSASRVKLPRPPPIASSDPLYRNGEYISDAALGLDDARRARIALELTPQAENLHIDAAVEDIFVNAGRLQ